MTATCDAGLDDKQEQVVVLYVTLVSATLSLFGASFMLVSFLLYSKGRFLSQMIAYLAFGDFGWAFAVIGQTVALLMQVEDGNVAVLEPIYGPNSGSAGSSEFSPGSMSSPFGRGQCIYRFVIYYFGNATYFWTCCISFHVLQTIWKRNPNAESGDEGAGGENHLEPSKCLQIGFHMIGWALPFGITLMMAPSYNPGDMYCSPPMFYAFILYGLVAAAFFFNLFVFIIVLRAHRKQFGTRGLWMYYRIDNKLVIPIPLRLGLYLLVFFCCWGFDFVAFSLLSYQCDLFALHVLCFAIANLQGAFDCVVYGLISTPLRRNYTWTSGLVTFLLGPLLVFPAIVVRIARSFAPPRRYVRKSVSMPSSASSKDSLAASSSDTNSSRSQGSWIAIN